MRISDWSSDVCSSDLPRRIDALLREEARGDLGFVPAARIEPAREAGNDEGLAGQLAVQGHGGGQPLRRPVQQRLPASGGDGAVRSEEQTSELQSLMRISYAVFCLKKKNTKTLRHRPNN